MTTHDRPAPPAGPITCQPWCQDGEGHADALCADDQICFTTELFVPTSTAEPVSVDGYGYCKPERLHVYGEIRPGEKAPRVVVSVDGGGAPAMTLSEVEELVEALQLILGQVGG